MVLQGKTGTTCLRKLNCYLFSGFVISAFATVLMHYTGFALLLVLLVYSLGQKASPVKAWQQLGMFLTIAGFVVLWGTYLGVQSTNFVSNAWLREFSSEHQQQTLLCLLALPVRFFLEVPGFLKWPEVSLIQAGAGSLVIAAITWASVRLRLPIVRLWLLWAFIPMAIFLAIDLSQSTVYLRLIRYLLIASPAIYVLAALALKQLPRAAFISVAAVGLILLSMQAPSAWKQASKPNWRLIANYLNTHAQPRDIFVYESLAMPPGFLDYLYCGVTFYLQNPDHRTLLLESELNPETRAALQQASRVWLITPFKSSRAVNLLKDLTQIRYNQFESGSELVEMAYKKKTGGVYENRPPVK